MAASSTWSEGAIHNVSLHSVRCSGFCQVHGKREYAYIISVEWTDDRRMFVKRTFAEFQTFHKSLVRLFPCLRQIEKTKLNLGAGITANLKDFMTKDKRMLAESREILVDTYLRNLLLLPAPITQSSLLLSFFESRKTDPKPCKSNAPSEKSDSGIDLTDDQRPKSLDEQRPKSLEVTGQHSEAEESSSPMKDSSSDNDSTKPKTSVKASDVDEDNIDSPEEFTSSEYEGDSEEGPELPVVDDDAGQDYFLDVAISELMLNSGHTSTGNATDSAPTSPESSMWCSTGDKFSQILQSSMHNLPSSNPSGEGSYDRRRRHIATTFCAAMVSDGEDDDEDLLKVIDSQQFITADDSSSPCQCQSADHDINCHLRDFLSEGEAELESDDEFSIKPIAKPDMGQYFLSTRDLKEDL